MFFGSFIGVCVCDCPGVRQVFASRSRLFSFSFSIYTVRRYFICSLLLLSRDSSPRLLKHFCSSTPHTKREKLGLPIIRPRPAFLPPLTHCAYIIIRKFSRLFVTTKRTASEEGFATSRKEQIHTIHSQCSTFSHSSRSAGATLKQSASRRGGGMRTWRLWMRLSESGMGARKVSTADVDD